MNKSYSLQQIQKTSNFHASLKSRQIKLNQMADFMRLKYEVPRMKQFSKSKSNRFIFFYSTEIQKRYKYAFTI